MSAPEELSDDALMGLSADDDRAAFEVLMDRYGRRVRGYLRRLVPGEDLANDLCQEVFLQVWHRRRQYEARGLFAAWLFRIARSLAISRVRRRRLEDLFFLRSKSQPQAALPPHTPEDVMRSRQDVDRLVDGIDALPAKLREVLVLRHTVGLDHRSIAATLGLSEVNVRQRCARALTLLRVHMEVVDDRAPL